MSETGWAIEEPEYTVLDRSTLERWANCPAQAKLIELHRPIEETQAMLVGTAIHDALSQTMDDYMGDPMGMSTGMVKEMLEQRMTQIRPDLQSDAVSTARYAAWSWAKYITEIHPANILRYDGGQGDHSGQLAWDLPWLGIRVTSEVDLLFSGPSPEVIHEIDYKTGYTTYSVDSVADSFQFQLHAALLLDAYPAVQAVDIRVWDIRRNQITYSTLFPRTKLAQYQERVLSACSAWKENQGPGIDAAAIWPESQKCGLCPVSQHCPRASSVMQTPVGKLRQLIVIEAARDLLRKELTAAVKTSGKDICTPEGDCFGLDKPKGTRPTYSLYGAKDKEE